VRAVLCGAAVSVANALTAVVFMRDLGAVTSLPAWQIAMICVAYAGALGVVVWNAVRVLRALRREAASQ